MSDNKPAFLWSCFVAVLCNAIVNVGLTVKAVADVQADVVFLIDGSSSVEPCLFEFQKETIATLLCGDACDPCSEHHLPHDGSIAVSVIQFAGEIPDDPSTPENDPYARVHVPLTILDSASEAGTQCAGVEAIDRFFGGGTTPLAAGLDRARDVLDASTTGATERIVIVLSDVSEEPGLGNPFTAAEILRTMGVPGELGAGYTSPPATIYCFRVSDFPNIEGDPTCATPPQDEILVEIANTPDSPNYEPGQTIGDFACREICEAGFGNYYPDDIEAFLDFFKGALCHKGWYDVVLVPTVDQTPPNPVTPGATVQLSVQAETTFGGAVHYQWNRNGLFIAGADESSLQVPAIALCDAGVFLCEVWTACDSDVSDPQTVFVDLGDEPDCDNNGFADACEAVPAYSWTGTVETPEGGDDGAGIAVDALGNVAYAGEFVHAGDAADVDFDPTDGFDYQYVEGGSNEGTYATVLERGAETYDYGWTHLYAELTPEFVNAIAFGLNNRVYVGGGADPEYAGADGFVRCYDPVDGTLLHEHTFAGDYTSEVLAICLDSSNNVIVTGAYIGTVNFDPGGTNDSRTANGNRDIFVTKLDANLGYLWTHVAAGAASTAGNGRAVAANSSGDIYVAGGFGAGSSEPTDFDADQGYDCPRTSCRSTSTWGNTSIFVMKLLSNGDFEWVASMGGNWDAEVKALCATDDDYLYMTGTFEGLSSFLPDSIHDPGGGANVCTGSELYCHDTNGNADVFLVKLIGQGTDAGHVWSRAFGGTSEDLGLAIALDPSDNVVLTGSFRNEVDFDPTNGLDCPSDDDPACANSAGNKDIFVTQWNSDGSYAWTHTMGGEFDDQGGGVAVDADGNVWLTGFFSDSVDFDPAVSWTDMHSATGGTDLFVTLFTAPTYVFVDCDDNGLDDTCECVKGDVDADGNIDGLDIQPFVDLLIYGPGQTDPCLQGLEICPADMDLDEDADDADIPCFVSTLLGDSCEDGRGGIADCNDNGIPDANDIAYGTSEDCNKNFIPDECDIDPADPDGDGLVSNDLNTNDVPDECEPDCNENGVPDDKDIADETSADVDGNGIPDECEPDCNNNNIPDAWDISQGTSDDCNVNGTPDECEYDCNENDVPDDCDVDPTDPDGDGEVSEDCNDNGAPDECDLTRPLFPSFDCNENGIPDECDIAACAGDPACDDCNENGFPDECDIASGLSQDENQNGIPDECEGAAPEGGGGGSGGGDPPGDPEGPAIPLLGEVDPEAAWGALFDWTEEQNWGPDSEISGAAQFQMMVNKLQELGLPVEHPWYMPAPSAAD